jgi:hypothetical protein
MSRQPQLLRVASALTSAPRIRRDGRWSVAISILLEAERRRGPRPVREVAAKKFSPLHFGGLVVGARGGWRGWQELS